jgi:hypothetical protein
VIFLDLAQEVSEWRRNGFMEHQTPDEVKTTFRFLAVVRSLRLCGSEAFMHATMKNRVAKLVITHVIDSYKVV